MLKIDFTKRATKFIKKLPPKQAKQIAQKIMSLRETPFPHDSKALVNLPFYRVDSGEYRIIYEIKENIIYIILIGKRNDNEVYKKLQRI